MTRSFCTQLFALVAVALAACTQTSTPSNDAASSPDTSVTDAPVTDAPVTDAPVTDAPVTDAPVADAPVTDAPVADVAADAPMGCASNADCASGQVCEFALGCDQTRGACHSNGCQSLPVAPQYCGCDGRTIQQTSACLPARAYRSMGACPDAGPVDAGSDAGGLPLGAECADGGACAEGLLCCYPCGIPGCVNRCMTPMAGRCPLLP